MLRQLAAPLAAAARNGLNKGISALGWTLLGAGLVTAGSGLLLAAIVIALSRLIGPALACGLVGLGLVLLSLLMTALRCNRPVIVPPQPATPPTPAPDQLAFAVGFALARLIWPDRR